MWTKLNPPNDERIKMKVWKKKIKFDKVISMSSSNRPIHIPRNNYDISVMESLKNFQLECTWHAKICLKNFSSPKQYVSHQ